MKECLIKLLQYALICALLCVFIAVGVAIILRTTLLANQTVYLYRLLGITAICFIILVAVSIIVCVKAKKVPLGMTLPETLLCIAASTLLMTLFFTLAPMTIERSYTIYSLADMTDNADVVYTAEDIKTQFIEGYIEGANESQKRIDEQVNIGNLEEVDGGYRISGKGKRTIGLFRLIETIFPVPDENSIYPNGK